MHFCVICALFSLSTVITSSWGLTVGPFTSVTGGVWDAWQQEDPENVRGGTFSAVYGDGKLWLISNRIYRHGSAHPWDPALRGGIVSTLFLQNKTWTHKTYGRVDEDPRGEKLFSLRGLMFMLTYSFNDDRVTFHRLFFWNQPEALWTELPFDIDHAATTLVTNAFSALTLLVPDSQGQLAYLASSSHAARRNSEMAYSKLRVEFNGQGVPANASVKIMVRRISRKPSAVTILAVRNGKLYAMVQNFLSEGYMADYDHAYRIDPNTNMIDIVNMNGTKPTVDARTSINAFETDSHVLVVGGMQMYGLAQMRRLHNIWALNIDEMHWEDTGTETPKYAHAKTAMDRANKKLYIVSLTEGVQVAQITE